MSRRSHDALRLRLADEAARLMSEHGMRDYRLAKEKAAQHLNMHARSSWPTNQQIDEALRERQSLFGGRVHLELQTQRREQALKLMQLLQGFSPALVGAVLQGTATATTPVQLHVFASSPEEVEIALHGHGIDVELLDRRLRFAAQDYEQIPCLKFATGAAQTSVQYEVLVFPQKGHSRIPLSPVDGKPFERAAMATVEQLLGSMVSPA